MKNLTKQEQEKLRSAFTSGIVEILKNIAMEKINDLRASRVKIGGNEDTLWNLAESIGGEKHILNLFDTFYDLGNQKG